MMGRDGKKENEGTRRTKRMTGDGRTGRPGAG